MSDEKLSYTQQRALALIKMSRFIITQADMKGLTHADKHFLMQTSLFLQHLAAKAISEGAFDWHTRNMDEIAPDDIPF